MMKTKKVCRMLAMLLVFVMTAVALPIQSFAAKEDYWFAEKEPVTDYAYSMVFVPDTQILLRNDPDNFHKIYDWILDNKEAKNIQYVLGLGDITDYDANDEWRLAYDQITRMDGVVPYSLIIGNHDSTERFNRTFNKEPYISSYEGSYDDKIENTWRTLMIGSIPYLILTLDFLPDDEILEWANGVVEAHPNHNVIVTTHAFLHSDGTPMSEGEGWHTTVDSRVRTNDADDIWEKFVRKHENIVLVVGGHIASDRVVMTQSYGDHDNIVTQVLIDHQDVDEQQGSAGMVCTFYFSADGSKVQVETYSTVRDLYYMPENQFSFELAVVGQNGPNAVTLNPPKRTQHNVPEKTTSAEQPTDIPENGNASYKEEESAETPEKEQTVQTGSNVGNSTEILTTGTENGTQNVQTTGSAETPSVEQELSDDVKPDNTLVYIIASVIAVVLVGAMAVIVVICKKRKSSCK